VRLVAHSLLRLLLLRPLQLAKTAPLQLSQLCANQTTPQFNQSVQFFLAQQQGQAGGMQQPFATATAYFRLLPSGHADIQQQQGMGQQQPMATGGYGGGYGQQDPTKNVGAGGYGGQQVRCGRGCAERSMTRCHWTWMHPRWFSCAAADGRVWRDGLRRPAGGQREEEGRDPMNYTSSLLCSAAFFFRRHHSSSARRV
jgi:hypothetical protein